MVAHLCFLLGAVCLAVQIEEPAGGRERGTSTSTDRAAAEGTKARDAADHGCDHTILYREVDFVTETKRIVPGGVSAVFDGVGKDTFVKSFDCTAPFGYLVNYGNASGQVPPIDILQLSLKGLLSICRVGISQYLGDPTRFQQASAQLFDLVKRGVLRTTSVRTYPLGEVASAHRETEAASLPGPIVLVP